MKLICLECGKIYPLEQIGANGGYCPNSGSTEQEVIKEK